MQNKKVRTRSLIIGLLVELIFSICMGVTAGSIGFGSWHPELNLIAKPFVCPDGPMSYNQDVTQLGAETIWSVNWFCMDKRSGLKTALDNNTIYLTAGLFFGLACLVVLLLITYIYWNSSIGPAKNDGLRLW